MQGNFLWLRRKIESNVHIPSCIRKPVKGANYYALFYSLDNTQRYEINCEQYLK